MTVLQPEVRPYLDRVRAALSDLPQAERDDLLDDLAGHLAEVADDAGADLDARLGPPEAYAAELRASAGLPPRGAGTPGRWAWRERLETLRGRVLDLPGARAVLAFLPELRPGWWVLRGWLVVVVAAIGMQDAYVLSRFPFVDVGGSLLVGTALVVAAMAASVRIGRARSVRWGPAVMLGNVLLLVAALAATGVVRQQYGVAVYEMSSGDPYGNVLRGPYGPINNFYAYDALGRPLFDVQLYDQAGRPVTELLLQTDDGRFTRPEYRFGTDGQPLRNVFPRQYTVDTYGTDGSPSTAPLPPPSIAARALPPKASASPAASPASAGASPAPSATPAPSPSPSP